MNRPAALSFLASFLIGAFSLAQSPATREVGFESGLPAARLSAEDRARIQSIPLQDLLDKTTGRYTLMKDDGVGGTWGLDAINSRIKNGPKPYDKLRRQDGTYQTERVVFADPGTGATMMMLSQLPYSKDAEADELCYFGKANWSADGSRMVWSRSAKPSLWGPGSQVTTDAFGPLVTLADGTSPRIAFGKGRNIRSPICSPTRPDISYTVERDTVLALSFKDDGVAKELGKVDGLWWLKLSPDDKYLMGRSPAGFWVMSTADGQKWDVKLDAKPDGKSHSVHDSYRFVPGDTDWIMFWYETSHPGGGLGKEGFHLRNFKTGEDKLVPFNFDWNHGDVGRYFGYHVGQKPSRWTGKTFEQLDPLFWPDKAGGDSGPYYSNPVHQGGYAAHWPDDQLWAYSLMYHQEDGTEYLSEISKVFAKGIEGGGRVNRFRICYNNAWGGKDRWGEPSINLMRPNMSPDGTKLLFSSNVFSRAGAYMVVCALPQAPTDITVRAEPGRAVVSWKPPKYHGEIAGYRVYRSVLSGGPYELVSPELVTATSFTDDKAEVRKSVFYTVRSVEHSMLESGLSDEAGLDRTGFGPWTIFCEAERAISADLDAPSPDAIWVNFEGFASDLYYIWQRRADRPGKVSLQVDVPGDGEFTVIARLKGKDGASFTIAGQDVTAPAGADWRWARSAAAARLKAGRQSIEIASNNYGSGLDCFYLTMDKGFMPAGRIVAPVPEPLELQGESVDGGHMKLSWAGPKSPRWHHYNIYCSDTAGFTPDRKTLIASPDRSEHLDWQGRGKRYYRVTQVTLDGLESKPSNEIER